MPKRSTTTASALSRLADEIVLDRRRMEARLLTPSRRPERARGPLGLLVEALSRPR